MRKLASLGIALIAAATLTAWASAGPPRQTTAGYPLAVELAAARQATAKYVTHLDLAKKNGYRIITPMIPNMGFHFMNPKVTGFDVTKPPILVYVKQGNAWQLGALEWVFLKKPATPPLPGARYGGFGAACHCGIL